MINNENVTTFYVSQLSGSDKNNGFYCEEVKDNNGPLKTLEMAISRVSEIRRSGYCQPISIKIMDNVYNVEKPVIIDNSAFLITIEPFTHCEIRGGKKIDGFIDDVFNGKKCFCADVSHLDSLDFSDFYINGKPATTTKYPQSGMLSPLKVENDTEALNGGSKWFIAKDEDFEVIKSFKNIENAHISYYHYWIDEHSPIEALDEQNKKIIMKYISRFSITPKIASANMEYVIENVGEMFCEPGHWYCDRKAKKLYYIPENDNMCAEDTEGFAPVSDKLFVITGEALKKAENISIRGFTLCYTKGEYRSTSDDPECTHIHKEDGFASDSQSVCEGHGSIEFQNARNCSLENCKLSCLGVHAINIKSGCSEIRILQNHLSYLGGGGVYVNGGGVGSDALTHTFDIEITDNTIVYGGRRYMAACGVLLRHTYECNVSHNEIGNFYYTGVSCGWTWGYGDSICRNNNICKNHIHHLGGGMLSDMGGVYTLGKQHGTKICGNIIHDVLSRHYGGWALYTDEGSGYITIENNICYNTSNNIYHQHFGERNTVRNNIFAFSKYAVVRHSHNTERIGIICEKNIIVINGNSPFGIRDIYEGKINAIKSNNNFIFDYSGDYNGAYMAIVGDDKNVVYNGNVDDVQLSESAYGGLFGYEDAVYKLCMEEGSIFIDPQFVDIANYDFRLKETSPVFKMGFKPIDTIDVGPRKRF